MEGVKWAKHYGGPVKKNSDEMESGGEKRERGGSVALSWSAVRRVRPLSVISESEK